MKVIVLLATSSLALSGCTAALIGSLSDQPRYFARTPGIMQLGESRFAVCNAQNFFIQNSSWNYSDSASSAFVVNLEKKWDKRGQSVVLLDQTNLQNPMSCKPEIPVCSKAEQVPVCEVVDDKHSDGVFLISKNGIVFLRLAPIKGNSALALLASPITIAADVVMAPLYVAYFGTFASDSK
jgi:hypothetical protein